MKIPFAAIVIIVVSALAFAAGYAQSQFSSSAAEYQRVASRIEEKMRFLKDLDGGLYLDALNLFYDASMVALEYWALENIGTGLTTNELLKYQLDFANKVGNANGLIESTVIVGEVHLRFLDYASVTEYKLATKENEGYDYIISRDTWDLYKPVRTVEKNQFLSDYMGLELILDEITLLTDNLDDLTDNPPFVFYEMNWDNIAELYGTPLNEAVNLATRNQNFADNITMGVSVTTIATVLATAMAGRLESKESEHNFTTIQNSLNIPPGLRTSKRDKFATMGLLLAVIISAFGLIMPIILLL